MTRDRIIGNDQEFCEWIRRQPDLPSSDTDFGLSVTDADLILHRYKTAVDGVGVREVQAIMQVEVKTRDAGIRNAQVDTLWKLHQFADERGKVIGEQLVRHFGVYLLRMSGPNPDTSERMLWGYFKKGISFDPARGIEWTEIDKPSLIGLLRFEIHPTNFSRNPFRRHHKTQEIVERVQCDLGFDVEKPVIKRS